MNKDFINELKKYIGKEVFFSFTGSGVIGKIKKVFDNGYIKLVDCSPGMDIQIVNVRLANIIEIENRRKK